MEYPYSKLSCGGREEYRAVIQRSEGAYGFRFQSRLVSEDSVAGPWRDTAISSWGYKGVDDPIDDLMDTIRLYWYEGLIGDLVVERDY